jgi:hypothetical protein
MYTKHLHMQTCPMYRAHLQIQFSKLFPGLSVQHIYVYIPSQKLNCCAEVAFTLFQNNLKSAMDVHTDMQMIASQAQLTLVITAQRCSLTA